MLVSVIVDLEMFLSKLILSCKLYFNLGQRLHFKYPSTKITGVSLPKNEAGCATELMGLTALAMSNLSRLWCEKRLTLTPKFRVFQCCVSMLGKVSMCTRLWDLDHSIGWRSYIQFWDQDHSPGRHKYIRFWNLDHSASWRKATTGIPCEMSAKNHRLGMARLRQPRGSQNKTSICPTK